MAPFVLSWLQVDDDLDQMEFHGKISVEQTLQIIYVRHGRSNLDDEITEIFGQQQKGSDGQELKISFSQYLALGSDELRWAQEHLSAF
ncbi:Tubulin alpha-3 chain [Durusdinium trenchii]|uniref:Tubulin alpha-3 chain n=1 Tax=Durusdinium trenchii TaxID=1381693 RepID=A0ABP0M997_9DINO